MNEIKTAMKNSDKVFLSERYHVLFEKIKSQTRMTSFDLEKRVEKSEFRVKEIPETLQKQAALSENNIKCIKFTRYSRFIIDFLLVLVLSQYMTHKVYI